MDSLCSIFSRVLDIIETEQIGASDRHGLRVAVLCVAMGKKLGYDDDALTALSICALFHDNALTEYQLSENELRYNGKNMILHCEKGQANMSWLPFKKDISGFILYHHERSGGKGPFGKHEGEYPFEAALIAAADAIDVKYKLQHLDPKDLSSLRDQVTADSGSYSIVSAVNVFLEIFDNNMLESLRDENVEQTLKNSLPRWEVDVSKNTVIGIAKFIAPIIDFKSGHTRKHTTQIANRTWLMADYYQFSQGEKSALYLAASLHDIGKMAIPSGILEKPDKLNKDEYEVITQHVSNTYYWLSNITDFDLIRDWASNHHEKLNGKGYPFGKDGSQLDFNSRLIACLDIYQAVIEARPYHRARSHSETMYILYSMAEKGLIDIKIVKDLDVVMEKYSMLDVPYPLD